MWIYLSYAFKNDGYNVDSLVMHAGRVNVNICNVVRNKTIDYLPQSARMHVSYNSWFCIMLFMFWQWYSTCNINYEEPTC